MIVMLGDVRARLGELAPESIQCIVTSPPYWGLRDYGSDGQIGLELTPDLYVGELARLFGALRTVLRTDGTLWLNLGDTYAGSWGAQSRGGNSALADRSVSAQQILAAPKRVNTGSWVKDHPTLKPKDLIGIPWRVAFALQASGWYLRSEVIWHKPNPMPESVTDRPTKAHETLFLLSKAEHYYYDGAAIREAEAPGTAERYEYDFKDRYSEVTDSHGYRGRFGGKDGFKKPAGNNPLGPGGRNKRSVWTIPTQPYPEAHFATFPEALVEPCIKAGSREGDTVLDPFAGSGTTLAVARRLGRKAIGIELQPDYLPLIQKRVRDAAMPLLEALA